MAAQDDDMGEREIAKEILLSLIASSNGMEYPTFVDISINSARDICKAFPDDKPHPCGFNELSVNQMYVPDDDEDV